MPKNTTIQIGTVLVDSGQLMLVDPCYLVGEHNKRFEQKDYDVLSQQEDGNVWPGQVVNHRAVKTSTGYGDGEYPVFATYNNEGIVSSIEVKFDIEEQDDEEEICSWCEGTGQCRECSGTGKEEDNSTDCAECDGTGECGSCAVPF